MPKRKSVFAELNQNLQEYRKDYEGFIKRSDYIEKREYKERCWDEKDYETLTSYGAL